MFQGLFGNTAASQSGGLFGAAQTSTATGFGTGTGLFGQPNTGFGNLGTQVAMQLTINHYVLQKLNDAKDLKVMINADKLWGYKYVSFQCVLVCCVTAELVW